MNSIKLLTAGTLLFFSTMHAQEQQVPSLRSLALDKSAELLHKQLVKPQSPAQRKIILDFWQDKAGILFNKSRGTTSDIVNPTILERFEEKYATQQDQIAYFYDADEICALTPDGKNCCYVNHDGAFWVLADIKSSNALKRFGRERSRITSLSLIAQSNKAITLSRDKTVKIWDLESGSCLDTIDVGTHHITNLSVSSDGTKAISSSDKNLILWDIATGKALFSLTGHTNFIMDSAITNDNTKAVSASVDRTIRIWDLTSGTCSHTLKTHTKTVNKLAIVPGSNKALSASDDTSIILWDLAKGTIIRRFEGHTSAVNNVVISSDCTKAISLSDDNTLKIWDLTTGECIKTIPRMSLSKNLCVVNNMIVQGNKIYQFENWQSIIDAMPQPQSPAAVHVPYQLLKTKEWGALLGIYQAKHSAKSKNRKK